MSSTLSPVAPARVLLAGLASLVLGPLAAGQAYVNNTGDIPQGAPFNNSATENVDFADIDLDGDFDAAFADGGDGGSDQNRIWVNMGFAQGGTLGVFVDQTATRCPAITDQSRDIEFVDFDADGDLDIYVSNTSAITIQSNRWWTNQGGIQGGTAGFYVDSTSTRWVGLGAAGSSIAPGQVLPSGGFIDFSCDCDFGDLDNDGDIDLVHSTYGGIFGGQVPTRLFLNNGLGLFSEFNPSGFQLTGQTIASGSPGIWCQGTYTPNTNDSTGAQCDIAATPLDIDVGDIDGDNDLDILHGARDERIRMFRNRLTEQGTLAFRDVTNMVLPSNASPGTGHYEQEMGDCDGDGDLDIYGLNWASLADNTLVNDGSGSYGGLVTLANSGSDDNEGDFVDYDNDGDIDLFVTSFGSANRLYRNNNNGGVGFTFTEVSFELSPQNLGTGLDGDGCDVDEDGDMDFMIAHDGGGANALYENTTQVPDTSAPKVVHLDRAVDRVAGPAPTVVRVKVYDNAPYYINWYNPTQLEYTVDGGAPILVPMRSSQGQVFRAEVPGTLVGQICYRAISTDQEGNTATSVQRCYAAVASSFCDASDGSHASCPCGNVGNPDAGCDIQQATGGVRLDVLAQTTSPLNRATVQGSGYPTDTAPGAVVIRGSGLDPASPVVFGDGLRCVAAPLVRLGATVASGGTSVHDFGHGVAAGTFYYQLWFRNTPAMFCTPDGFNLSNGRSLIW